MSTQSDAVQDRPSFDEEIAKFQGFSTTDGEVSDGSQTDEETTRLATEAAQAEADAAAATANDAKKAADEEAARVAAQVNETPEQKAEREASETAAKSGKKGKPAADRIQELNTKYRTAERRAEAAEARLAELEKKTTLTTPASASTGADVVPDPADFDLGEMDGKYIAALAKYEVRQEMRQENERQAAQRQTEAESRAATEHVARVDAFAEQGVEKFADFDEVVIESAKAGEWPLTPVVGELSLGSKFGHEIVYHLATHVGEAEALAKLSPAQQAAQFGRLEAKFEAEAASPPAQVPVKTSKAPIPVKVPRGPTGQFEVNAATSDFAAFEAKAMGRG